MPRLAPRSQKCVSRDRRADPHPSSMPAVDVRRNRHGHRRGRTVYGAGGLPGLAGAAVGTADRGGDLRLEAVSALAPVQGLILRCRGALGAEALRGSEVLGGRARVTPAGASGDLCGEMH